MNAAYRKIKRSIWKMKKKKIKILHVAQAAGGVDRYIRMLLKYLDKEKFENILVCSQDFREKDYKNLVDFFEQVKMDAIPNIICNNENGLLVDADDPISASEAVLRIYSDERFKSTLIKAGRETVNKKYDIRRVSEESAKMFEELTR